MQFTIQLKIKIKEEGNIAVLDFKRCLRNAAKLAIPSVPKTTPDVSYPAHIADLVTVERLIMKTWQRNRSPAPKTKLNRHKSPHPRNLEA